HASSCLSASFLFLLLRLPPCSSLFPYTTLFRSGAVLPVRAEGRFRWPAGPVRPARGPRTAVAVVRPARWRPDVAGRVRPVPVVCVRPARGPALTPVERGPDRIAAASAAGRADGPGSDAGFPRPRPGGRLRLPARPASRRRAVPPPRRAP